MSAPVDVFEVMDRYGFVCGDPNSDCNKARRAIAELIASRRCELAKAAMQGIIANGDLVEACGELAAMSGHDHGSSQNAMWVHAGVAVASVGYADALIVALTKEVT